MSLSTATGKQSHIGTDVIDCALLPYLPTCTLPIETLSIKEGLISGHIASWPAHLRVLDISLCHNLTSIHLGDALKHLRDVRIGSCNRLTNVNISCSDLTSLKLIWNMALNEVRGSSSVENLEVTTCEKLVQLELTTTKLRQLRIDSSPLRKETIAIGSRIQTLHLHNCQAKLIGSIEDVEDLHIGASLPSIITASKLPKLRKLSLKQVDKFPIAQYLLSTLRELRISGNVQASELTIPPPLRILDIESWNTLTLVAGTDTVLEEAIFYSCAQLSNLQLSQEKPTLISVTAFHCPKLTQHQVPKHLTLKQPLDCAMMWEAFSDSRDQ